MPFAPIPRRRRTGFTLVELIVVIGIIGLLMGIILPTVGRVREQVKMMSCLSNLKQIGQAMSGYANANGDWFPFAASVGGGPKYEDWVHWQQLPTQRDVTKSAIARYLTTDKDQLERVLRCPYDPLARKDYAGGKYMYTYTMNHMLGSNYNPKISRTQIPRPEEKVLLIEETGLEVDDGRWVAPGNKLATWHDREALHNTDDGRGGVVFADGHGGFITRRESNNPKFYDPLKK